MSRGGSRAREGTSGTTGRGGYNPGRGGSNSGRGGISGRGGRGGQPASDPPGIQSGKY